MMVVERSQSELSATGIDESGINESQNSTADSLTALKT